MGHSAAKVPLGAQQGRRRPAWNNHHGELEEGLCRVSRGSGLLAPTRPGAPRQAPASFQARRGESGPGGSRRPTPPSPPNRSTLVPRVHQLPRCTLHLAKTSPLSTQTKSGVVQCGCPQPSSAGQSPCRAGGQPGGQCSGKAQAARLRPCSRCWQGSAGASPARCTRGARSPRSPSRSVDRTPRPQSAAG